MVDALLATYSSMVGDDFIGYRNHVCRVVSLCLAISGDGPDYEEKVTVAAVFHDLGIWTNHTFDYVAPSVALARDYLAACSRANWIPEIEAMIVNHHKISPSHSDPRWLVEPFRRADWIDVSCGLRRFSLPRPFIASLYTTWPTAGFHLRLAELALNRFRRHPLTPLPMVRL